MPGQAFLQATPGVEPPEPMCVIVIYAVPSGDPEREIRVSDKLYCTAQLNNKTSANACGHLLPLVKPFKPFFFQRIDAGKAYNGRLSAQS